MVSLDALAFVRFGLRAPDDPRIVNTVKVVDATLKVDTPRGPVWHRYQGDGYGEHADGGPFDGTGVGRAWPLLTGERAHYELAAGRRDVAEATRARMEAWRVKAVSFPSRSGIAPTFLIADCSSGTRPARRCRSCGHMPSTSSCADPFGTERSSIGRRRPFSDTSWRRRRHAISSGASTTRFARCRRAEPARRDACPGRRALERRWLAHRARYADTRHDARRPRGGSRDAGPAHRRPRGLHVLLARGGPMGRDRFCRLRRMMKLRISGRGHRPLRTRVQ